MTHPIPRDPVALMAARLTVAFLALLIGLSLLPRQDAPMAPVVRAQAPLVPQPTHAAPEPPPPQQAPVSVPAAAESAPTAAPVAVMPAPAPPPSQLVHNADGSVSLPGSEAWLDEQPAVTNADPQLQIARDAAAAYQSLPVAQPPSAENDKPVRVRRPYTGR